MRNSRANGPLRTRFAPKNGFDQPDEQLELRGEKGIPAAAENRRPATGQRQARGNGHGTGLFRRMWCTKSAPAVRLQQLYAVERQTQRFCFLGGFLPHDFSNRSEGGGRPIHDDMPTSRKRACLPTALAIFSFFLLLWNLRGWIMQREANDSANAHSAAVEPSAYATSPIIEQGVSALAPATDPSSMLREERQCFSGVGEKEGALLCLPSLFFIGASKAGTTSLAKWLRAHPSIVSLVAKRGTEAHVFDRPPPLDDARLREISSRLLRRLPNVTDVPQAVVMDYTPNYSMSAEAPHAILGVLGRERCTAARYVIVLRDPVERTISSWIFKQGTRAKDSNTSNSSTLAEAATAGMAAAEAWMRCHYDADAASMAMTRTMTTDGALADRHLRACNPMRFFGGDLYRAHLGKSVYYLQLQNWLSVVPRERLLVLLLEDLARDPLGQLGRVLAFAGLPPIPPWSDNSGGGGGGGGSIAGNGRVIAIRGNKSAGRSDGNGGDGGESNGGSCDGNGNGGGTTTLTREDWQCIVSRRSNVTPRRAALRVQATPELRLRLARFFAPLNARLDALLGRRTGYPITEDEAVRHEKAKVAAAVAAAAEKEGKRSR
ncbi:unnamed protein product [Phaeothamnion confervicola]